MSSFVNGCVFIPASSGTGSFVVSAAVTGWQTPAQAAASNGAQYSYRAYSADNTQWEIGVGVYTSGTVTLTRTPTASSNAGSAVNFTVAPSVALTVLATDLTVPTSLSLVNATGLAISTGVSGLGTGVATFLATPSSANLISAVTDETGSGALVFANTPTLVTPILGTPTSGTLTNATGLPISTGVSGLGTGVAAFLATPSSANLITAVTDETGTGALVFANTPTLVTPVLGAATGTSLSVSGALTSTAGVLTASGTGTHTLAGPLSIAGASAGQIVFPASQNASAGANTLDDYEEGTWTPGLTFGGSGTGVVGTFTGTYVKIGQMVFARANVTLTNNGSGTGLALITGLPFTCETASWAQGPVWVNGGGSSASTLFGIVNGSNTTMGFYTSGATAAAQATETNLTDTFDARITILYRASA